MELAGYWGIENDQHLTERLTCASRVGHLLLGRKWALAATPSGRDDPDTVTSVTDDRSRDRGLVIGRVYSGTGSPPEHVPVSAFAEYGTRPLPGLLWGSYVAAAVLGPGDGERLVAAGDPLGLRSCFWARYRSGYVFASRLADLVNLLGYRPEFNWEHIRSFLAYGALPTTVTGFESVSRGLAGALVQFGANGSNQHTVWSPFTGADPAGQPPPAHELRDLIDRCIDVWAGQADTVYVELSGGIDSAVVAQAAVRTGRRVIAGHFHHGASALADEVSYARTVAGQLGIRLEIIDVVEALPLTTVGSPGRRWDAPGAHLVWESLAAAHDSIAQAHGCTVSMSGAGGDHVFAARSGWPWHLHDHFLGRQPRATLNELATTSRVRGIPLIRLVADLASWELARRRRPADLLARLLSDFEPPTWLTAPVETIQILVPPLPRLAAGKMGQALELALLSCDIGARHDTASPERRVWPLLSQPLVELGLRTRLDAHIDAHTDRILLRQAMDGLLPAVVLERANKAEHTATWQRGLRANVSLARELIADGHTAQHGIIDPQRALDALSAAALGHSGRLWPLVNLLAVELWIRSWQSS